MSSYGQKTVHVNAYTKNDGTHVKEHYRGIGNSNGIMSEKTPEYRDDWGTDTKNPLDKLINILTGKDTGTKRGSYNLNAGSNIVLSGGVSTSNIDFSNILSAVLSVGSIAITVGITAAQVAGKLYKAGLIGNVEEKAKLKPQLHTEIQKIKETQNLADKIEKSTLNKLVNTKNQQEYSELYKTLAEQRDLNQKNRLAISRLEYASQHEDYQTVISELNNYQSNYKTAETARTISSMPSMDTNRVTVNTVTPQKPNSIGQKLYRKIAFHDHPDLQKTAISAYMFATQKANPDASEFWKAAADDFKNSAEYIQQNGYLINSVEELPTDLKSHISTKLQQQLGKSDAKGLVLKPDSRLSKELAHSDEFKSFVNKHFLQLINHESVTGSGCFMDTINSHLAIKNADIKNLHIDSQGNLRGYIIDTYDFNKGENILVDIARNVQQNGLITGFYTINVIVVPFEEWIKFL